MKKRNTELHGGGKEVFKNGMCNSIPTLKDIVICDSQKKLEDLISVKIVGYKIGGIDQYNIETKRFITNITTHNGLDLMLTQYNKETKKTENYSPYSNPGYNIFVNLLVGYFETFKKRPNINFTNTDIDGRNKQEKARDIPLRNFIDGIRWDHGLYLHLFHHDLLKQDSNELTRPIVEGQEDDKDRKGIGFKGDTTVMKMENYSYGFGASGEPTIATIVIENELIPLYLQAFIDTNFRVAGACNAANLKKVYEMIFYVLENKNPDKESLINDAWRNTPLTTESE